MPTYTVIHSQAADRDIENIATYIAQDNPFAALAFAKELIEAIQTTLSEFPRKHQRRKDCYQYTYKRNYLVFFDIEESSKTVNVLAVTRAARYLRYKEYFE